MTLEAVLSDPALRPRGLTRAQYDALVELGALEGERVELPEGVLVEVVPQGREHEDAIEALNHHLVPLMSGAWRVRVQMSLAVSDRSEPEPDLAVADRSRPGKPTTAALVVEVAVSSHRADLVHKPAMYAAAGVEQYWVIDVPAREVVVHRGPGPGGYADVQRLPWTTPLEVPVAPPIPVDLAELLADL